MAREYMHEGDLTAEEMQGEKDQAESLRARAKELDPTVWQTRWLPSDDLYIAPE